MGTRENTLEADCHQAPIRALARTANRKVISGNSGATPSALRDDGEDQNSCDADTETLWQAPRQSLTPVTPASSTGYSFLTRPTAIPPKKRPVLPAKRPRPALYSGPSLASRQDNARVSPVLPIIPPLNMIRENIVASDTNMAYGSGKSGNVPVPRSSALGREATAATNITIQNLPATRMLVPCVRRRKSIPVGLQKQVLEPVQPQTPGVGDPSYDSSKGLALDSADMSNSGPTLWNIEDKARVTSVNTACKISRTMSPAEIIQQLVMCGCRDIMADLLPSSCSERPLAWGGFGDVYQGQLRSGVHVAIKCVRMLGSLDDDEKQQMYTMIHGDLKG
ncbi:hypothetical protein FRC07_012773, partial [Ceratobasidium sp. 392]